MKRIFVASPYAGDVGANVALAQSLCRDVITAGHAPFAPHLMMPQFLDDRDSREREVGITAGLAWLQVCDEVWCWPCVSRGMAVEITHAERFGIPVRIAWEESGKLVA